jgi:hypothetical protein
MDRVIVDEVLRQKLQELKQESELMDASGLVLGTFKPAHPPFKRLPGEPTLSDEELRAIEQEDKWYSTEEVLAHLKSLGNQ